MSSNMKNIGTMIKLSIRCSLGVQEEVADSTWVGWSDGPNGKGNTAKVS